MEHKLALLLALAALAQTALSEMTWSPCDADATAFTPDSVVLNPDPAIIGSSAVFSILGATDSEVSGGTVEIAVSFMGIQIFSQTDDLCKKTDCPVAAGPINITLVEYLPPIAPPGDYGLQVIARDPDGAELVCIQVDFQLAPPQPPGTARGSGSSGGSSGGRGIATGSGEHRKSGAGSGGGSDAAGMALV